ncbi:MAG: hypothetical protein V7727_20165 [Sneathiella sp.]
MLKRNKPAPCKRLFGENNDSIREEVIALEPNVIEGDTNLGKE